MIAISCADYAFPLLPREKRFALIKLLGFDYVDVGLFERSDGLRPTQMLAEPRKFARQLTRDIIHAGLRASDVFLQTGMDFSDSPVNDPNRVVRSENRKKFLLMLELCAELKCAHVTGLPGVSQKSLEDEVSFQLAVVEADWRHRVASHAGICYAIKPHVDSISSNLSSVRKLLEAVPGLTLTLDYGQFVSQKISSRHVHCLLPYASHIHVRGSGYHRLQVPLERSQIDFRGMFKRLHKNGYDGFVAIEYLRDCWKRCNCTDNVSETVLLRNLLTEYLRQNYTETAMHPKPSAFLHSRGASTRLSRPVTCNT